MNKLKQEFMGLPLYAWLAGGAALLLSILYFSKHKGASSSGTSSGTGAPTGPQNIYDSTNIYSQPGSAPGSAQVAPPPVPQFRPPNRPPRDIPPVLSATNGAPPMLPGGGIGVKGGRDGYGGGEGGGPTAGTAAIMPHPIQPNRWQPPMNSDIFGSGPGSGSPVSPVIVWDMTPTQAYTQS